MYHLFLLSEKDVLIRRQTSRVNRVVSHFQAGACFRVFLLWKVSCSWHDFEETPWLVAFLFSTCQSSCYAWGVRMSTTVFVCICLSCAIKKTTPSLLDYRILSLDNSSTPLRTQSWIFNAFLVRKLGKCCRVWTLALLQLVSLEFCQNICHSWRRKAINTPTLSTDKNHNDVTAVLERHCIALHKSIFFPHFLPI